MCKAKSSDGGFVFTRTYPDLPDCASYGELMDAEIVEEIKSGKYCENWGDAEEIDENGEGNGCCGICENCVLRCSGEMMY